MILWMQQYIMLPISRTNSRSWSRFSSSAMEAVHSVAEDSGTSGFEGKPYRAQRLYSELIVGPSTEMKIFTNISTLVNKDYRCWQL